MSNIRKNVAPIRIPVYGNDILSAGADKSVGYFGDHVKYFNRSIVELPLDNDRGKRLGTILVGFGGACNGLTEAVLIGRNRYAYILKGVWPCQFWAPLCKAHELAVGAMPELVTPVFARFDKDEYGGDETATIIERYSGEMYVDGDVCVVGYWTGGSGGDKTYYRWNGQRCRRGVEDIIFFPPRDDDGVGDDGVGGYRPRCRRRGDYIAPLYGYDAYTPRTPQEVDYSLYQVEDDSAE